MVGAEAASRAASTFKGDVHLLSLVPELKPEGQACDLTPIRALAGASPGRGPSGRGSCARHPPLSLSLPPGISPPAALPACGAGVTAAARLIAAARRRCPLIRLWWLLDSWVLWDFNSPGNHSWQGTVPRAQHRLTDLSFLWGGGSLFACPKVYA